MSPFEHAVGYSDMSVGYEALANARRRDALRLLDATGSPKTLRELAEALAEREVDSPDEDTVESVQTSLYHVHVPKLAEAGFVKYDEDADRVLLTTSAPLDAIEALEG